MSCVVCATRGGEGSRAAQLHAIQRAKEEQAGLVFLYIVDRHMAEEHDSALGDAVQQELLWLGRVLMSIARERAAQLGVEADIHIGHGHVREEIIHFVDAQDAFLLVLGAPRNTTSHFGDDPIELFAADIERQTGVHVEIARPESL